VYRALFIVCCVCVLMVCCVSCLVRGIYGSWELRVVRCAVRYMGHHALCVGCCFVVC